MSKILQIFLQTAIGIIMGGIFWTLAAFIIVSLLTYKYGAVPMNIFGAGSIDGKFIILPVALGGMIQGFLIGLASGYLGVNSVLKGAVTGVIASIAGAFALLILSNKSLITDNRDLSYKLSTLASDIPGFVFFSILLIIPSVIIGIATVKTFALVRAMLNLND